MGEKKKRTHVRKGGQKRGRFIAVGGVLISSTGVEGLIGNRRGEEGRRKGGKKPGE